MDFTSQMKAFENMTLDKANNVFRKTCFDLSNAVIMDTPVDKGRARANWQPDINTFKDDVLDTEDKAGTKTVSKVKSTVDNLPLGSSFTLSNNLPYIVPLEYGWSKKSPEGMIRRNLIRFDSILKQANKDIK